MSGKTILVVDDEYSVLESLTDILELEGYTVVSAANGLKAQEALEKALPDAVLLDYMMPVMDGVQLLARMEARGWLGRVPVVMMTAAPSGLPKDPKARRWTALLAKPFELPELLSLLEKVIAERAP